MTSSTIKLVCLFVIIGIVNAMLTVEEAWSAYQANPDKEVAPEGEITNFNDFKANWDEAKRFLNEFATTQDAWEGYKQKYRTHVNISPDEDETRFELFKPRWEAMVKHNEKYARGEIYYPHWTEPTMHFTEAELEERRKLPKKSPRRRM